MGALRILIAYSTSDAAGLGMAASLLRALSAEAYCESHGEAAHACSWLGANLEIVGLEGEPVYFESLDSFGADAYVILSKHSSLAGRPSLTVHPPGNPWGRSDCGGDPWSLPPSNPQLMWYLLRNLEELARARGLRERFSVTYEVTHHGPTRVSKPITFLEIGSGEREWSMPEAHDVAALALLAALRTLSGSFSDWELCRVAVGVGGSHYAPLFTKRALSTGECYGHMIPSYVVKALTPQELGFVVAKALDATPGARVVVLEKMRSDYRRSVLEVARSRGLEVVDLG